VKDLNFSYIVLLYFSARLFTVNSLFPFTTRIISIPLHQSPFNDGSQPSDKKESLFSAELSEQLRGIIMSLKNGWLDEDSVAPSKDLIETIKSVVITLLDEGAPEPEVCPVEDGSIDLNWEDKRLYCTLSEEELTIRQLETQTHQSRENRRLPSRCSDVVGLCNHKNIYYYYSYLC
jgi:hypothetical protein